MPQSTDRHELIGPFYQMNGYIGGAVHAGFSTIFDPIYPKQSPAGWGPTSKWHSQQLEVYLGMDEYPR